LDRFPHMKVPLKPWRDPLESKNQQELLAVLKNSGREVSNSNDDAGRKQTQSNWTAQLHFVWDVILAHFVRLAESGKGETADQFKSFWTRVVDGRPTKVEVTSRGLTFSQTASSPEALQTTKNSRVSRHFKRCSMGTCPRHLWRSFSARIS
jgi:hypothetical protein